jgi:hypothetical protein
MMSVRKSVSTSFTDPTTGSFVDYGTAIDNTYTSIPDLKFMGGWWQGSSKYFGLCSEKSTLNVFNKTTSYFL